MRVFLFLIAAGVLALLPARASTISFSSPTNTYYVGVEDLVSSSCDCDFNDLVFSVSASGVAGTLNLDALYGAGFLQSSLPSLATGDTSLNNGSPFWDNMSSDSTYANFGECIYESGAQNTCNGGTAVDPTAQYLAGPGNVNHSVKPDGGDAGGSVDFYFSDPTDATVRFNLIQSIAANSSNDEGALYACPQGGAVDFFGRANCISVSLISGSATLTSSQVKALGGSFDLLFYSNSDHGNFGPFDSNTSVSGNTDGVMDHFAVTVGEPTVPEPATFALVGGVLIGLGGFRRWRGKGRTV